MARNNNINKPRKKGKRFRIDFVMIACVVVFIACFVIYMIYGRIEPGPQPDKNLTGQNSSSESNINNNSAAETSATTVTTTAPPVAKPANPVPESAALTADYFNSCAFIGDSLTSGLSSYNIVPSKNVIASVGMNISKIDTELIDTIYGKLTAINALAQLKPANVYIMLGSNGIAWLSNDTMTQKYGAFIESIKKLLPDSKIYVLSIPPVAVERETAKESPIQNSAIDSYNSELLKMANAKNVYFVDVNTALKNNQGKLDSNKSQKDGMHFTKEAYGIMINYILTHVAK